ncbi:MAG: hypothetical protein M3033_14065 [Acidobacteriota bacterium]|nr:hypothetical protein [Acidobacteriota bacterium]
MKKDIETAEKNFDTKNERGVSLVITLLVMVMLLGFVALALSRTSSEAQVSYNDAAEAKALAASEAGLEDTTRDFATVLENKLNPTNTDVQKIKDNVVNGFDTTYDMTKTLTPIGSSKLVVIPQGEFQGLYSLRDEWQINVNAREKNTDVQVETMRRFYNNRIPLFQFGAFYQDDLELNRPPLFTFSGKVHTNSNIFISSSQLSSGGGIFFKSKVTAAGEVVNDIWKTATKLASPTDDNGDVYFPNASGVNQQLTVGNGSVKCTVGTGTGGVLKDINGRGRPYPYPNCTKNANWVNYSKKFDGNLQANTPELRLPVDRLNVPLIEIMRRGRLVGDKANENGSVVAVSTATQDNDVVSKERYANKQGIRISLADSKDKLPGCASITIACGVQLDASLNIDGSRGYQPLPMSDNATYKTTAVNGNRLAISGRGTWIKVEKVDFDYDASVPVTTDITEDFLSLGMTEPVTDTNFKLMTNYISGQDSRSIIKIQHFFVAGTALPDPSATSYVTSPTMSSQSYNFVGRYKATSGNADLLPTSPCYNFIGTHKGTCANGDAFAAPLVGSGSTAASSEEYQHYKLVCINNGTNCTNLANGNNGTGTGNGQGGNTNNVGYIVVPFPIQMYDSREGNRVDSSSGVSAGFVYKNGVMSLIDIDVANLREFFKGTWNGKFPTTTPFAISNGGVGLKSTDIPDNRGWVLYVSDRRGDADFDGRYTMEDVNPTGSLVDEDLNDNGVIDSDYVKEAPTQNSKVEAGLSAVTDHQYYRRGVRLINGTTIPGNYDTTTPANTEGFTFASENGIYVKGNYNTTNVTLSGTTAPADANNYFPHDTALHIPASIVGDSVTILSNSWNDANSFTNAFDTTQRIASNTQVRFAMIAGDSLTNRTASSTSGDFDGLNGGLHNFMRFVETWNGKRFNYSGSLVNLYNSFNNNGKWKCCTTVYTPPTRDWTFDNSFNDPNRLPPGSPFVYYLSFTGFQRVNQ